MNDKVRFIVSEPMTSVNVDIVEAERLVLNYLTDTEKLTSFMTDNDGNRACSGNH